MISMKRGTLRADIFRYLIHRKMAKYNRVTWSVDWKWSMDWWQGVNDTGLIPVDRVKQNNEIAITKCNYGARQSPVFSFMPVKLNCVVVIKFMILLLSIIDSNFPTSCSFTHRTALYIIFQINSSNYNLLSTGILWRIDKIEFFRRSIVYLTIRYSRLFRLAVI